MTMEKGLNKSGNKRGMSLNSHKNIVKALEVLKGNNHAKADISITAIQREMMRELCPYAKDHTWTWAYAIAEAGMKDALTEEKARENLKDRMEGKIAQPVIGENDKPIQVEIDVKPKLISLLNRLLTRSGEAESDTKPQPEGSGATSL